MDYVDAGADISPCGRYRYRLWRVWDRGLSRLVFIMLNPSTADGRADDPTIRSCARLARALGYGAIEIVNLFAWRATKPADLPLPPSRARGAGNARAIEAAVRRGVVVCAWGAHKYAVDVAPGVLSVVALHKRHAYCLGRTKSGAPRHPLYVRTDAKLEIYWERQR